MATVSKRTWTGADGKAKEAWRVSYTDAAGKRIHVQKRTKKEADAYRIRVEGEVVAGIHTPDAQSVTVQEACKVWLGAAESGGCDRGTLKSYREVVNVHIVPLIGREKLSQLSGPKIVAFRDALLGAGRSHVMTSKVVRHLSMILGEARNRGLVAQNNAHGVKVRKPREDGKRSRLAKRAEIPATDHLKLILAAAERLSNEDPRLPVLMRIVMLAGLRQSELRGLRWPSIDLKGCIVKVCERADRWGDIGFPKSDDSVRSITVGPDLAARLRAWKLRCPLNDQNLVFPNARGGVMDQKGMTGLFLRVQVEAGLAIDSGKRDAKGRTVWLPRYGLHDLRHVAASMWIAQGVDLKSLQVWIGHANIQLTLDVYGHLIKDAEKEAAMAAKAEAMLA